MAILIEADDATIFFIFKKIVWDWTENKSGIQDSTTESADIFLYTYVIF
jgi:hypothetical protein